MKYANGPAARGDYRDSRLLASVENPWVDFGNGDPDRPSTAVAALAVVTDPVSWKVEASKVGNLAGNCGEAHVRAMSKTGKLYLVVSIHPNIL